MSVEDTLACCNAVAALGFPLDDQINIAIVALTSDDVRVRRHKALLAYSARCSHAATAGSCSSYSCAVRSCNEQLADCAGAAGRLHAKTRAYPYGDTDDALKQNSGYVACCRGAHLLHCSVSKWAQHGKLIRRQTYVCRLCSCLRLLYCSCLPPERVNNMQSLSGTVVLQNSTSRRGQPPWTLHTSTCTRVRRMCTVS